MMRQLLNNRIWMLKFSFKNRVCYITGKPLWMRLAYRGRKYVSTFMNRHKPIADDVWVCRELFISKYSRNEIT